MAAADEIPDWVGTFLFMAPEATKLNKDDGEKFGVWPKTQEIVYGQKWLEQFFEGLVKRRSRVQTVLLSDAVASSRPRARVYLPSASYPEMQGWALPPEQGKTLDRLRDEGVIKAWGLGVNRVEAVELLLDLDGPRPDGSLLAGRYTLLDHSRALQRLMPKVAERGLGIVVGGPYSSGALVGGPNFEYAPATPEILARVAAIKAIADRHGIRRKALRAAERVLLVRLISALKCPKRLMSGFATARYRLR